jgi:hypothetical protein
MTRTSFGFKAASGLVIAATLLALASLSSRGNAAEPQASNLAMALTCPEQQGQLKRLSASSDGASCTYGIDSDKTFQASLLRVNADQTSPVESYMFLFMLFDDKLIDYFIGELKKNGIKLTESDLEADSDSKIYSFISVGRPKSKKSDTSSGSAAMSGYKLEPVAIGIYKIKDEMNDAVNEDFAALMKGATASWINPAQPVPPH